MENLWQNKTVLVTGCCGTIGQELVRQLEAQNPKEIVGIDNNETELFFLCETYRQTSNVHCYLGDVRDRDTLMGHMKGVDIVLHTAALKHVILCEQAPSNAVQTNILGTQNVIEAALANEVDRVLFTSSDKAVNPTNVMGTSKLMGERLITAANALRRGSRPLFASTRFGNVLGSRGSVIPIFERQIKAGGPVTLTDESMSRFIMTIPEAVSLVMDSVWLAKGGEVFITKMPVVRIKDLARVMIQELAPQYGLAADEIETTVIGSKPGEKMYEELMNDEEVRRSLELPAYFAVTPAFKSVYERIHFQYPDMLGEGCSIPYNSNNQECLSDQEIKRYLQALKLIEIEAKEGD